MKKKYIYYALLPVLAFSLAGAGAASAHGFGGMFGPGANLTPEELASRQLAMFQEQADLLGLSVDQIKIAWAQGQSLPEIAKVNNISQADLQKKMQAKRQAQLASQLKTLAEKGVITQAQAEARAQFMAANTSKKGMGRAFAHGFGLWR